MSRLETAADGPASREKWRVIVLTESGEHDISQRLLSLSLEDEGCLLTVVFQRDDPQAPVEWWSSKDIALQVLCRDVLIGYYDPDHIRVDHESGQVHMRAKGIEPVITAISQSEQRRRATRHQELNSAR